MLLDVFIEDVLGGTIQEGRANALCDCPACGKENHFYFHRETGLGYCHVCEYSVNLVQAIADVEGVSWAEALRRSLRLKRPSTREHLGQLYERLLALIAPPAVPGTVTECPLPRGLVPLEHPAAHAGQRYLLGRGFTPMHWAGYGILYAASKDPELKHMHRHLLFPELDSSARVYYYTTRAAFQVTRGQKSYHPKGLSKQNTLYGLSAIPAVRDWCILVEGPLDVLAFPHCAVALLGKQMAEGQGHLLKKRFRAVHVCLDADAQRDALVVADRLHRHGIDTYLAGYETGDPADHKTARPSEAIRDLLQRTRRYTLQERLAAMLG